MAEKATTYLLDEPTTGLHLADVDKLLALLDRLVDDGNTVVVIEHHQAVMAHADWLIDLGPGAGQDGGRIVFTGTPADLVASGETLTAQHLRRVRVAVTAKFFASWWTAAQAGGMSEQEFWDAKYADGHRFKR